MMNLNNRLRCCHGHQVDPMRQRWLWTVAEESIDCANAYPTDVTMSQLCSELMAEIDDILVVRNHRQMISISMGASGLSKLRHISNLLFVTVIPRILGCLLQRINFCCPRIEFQTFQRLLLFKPFLPSFDVGSLCLVIFCAHVMDTNEIHYWAELWR